MNRTMTNSFLPILDREYGTKNAVKFKAKHELLKEVLDYGTMLVPRAFDSGPKDIKAICLLFVQLRQFLVHLDAVGILSAQGASASLELQLRSMLELLFTIEWILKADTQEKVDHLYVANLRSRRRWQAIGITGSPEANDNAKTAARLKAELPPEAEAEFKREVASIDSALATPPYDSINAKFEPFYKKNKRDSEWYKVYVKGTTIRSIAHDVNRAGEYKSFYSSFSSSAHGSNIFRSILFSGQSVEVNEIRQPQNVPKSIDFAVMLALEVYRHILEEYRPGEAFSNFPQKYLTNWKQRHELRYNVRITPVVHQI
jgi:hypothetical protein